jgi:CheY-like chemotaxis protein
MTVFWFQEQNSPTAAPRGILVVDDQPEVRTVVKQLLERLGWSVRTAAGSDEATAILRQEGDGVALAFIDVLMPDCDGVSLAMRFRKEWPRLAIVLLSGNLKEESRWVVQEQGFRFLPKPVGLDELRDVIAEMTGGAGSSS